LAPNVIGLVEKLGGLGAAAPLGQRVIDVKDETLEILGVLRRQGRIVELVAKVGDWLDGAHKHLLIVLGRVLVAVNLSGRQVEIVGELGSWRRAPRDFVRTLDVRDVLRVVAPTTGTSGVGRAPALVLSPPGAVFVDFRNRVARRRRGRAPSSRAPGAPASAAPAPSLAGGHDVRVLRGEGKIVVSLALGRRDARASLQRVDRNVHGAWSHGLANASCQSAITFS
jgi:hypothetical protein